MVSPVFVKHGGQLIPFQSQAEAADYVAGNQPVQPQVQPAEMPQTPAAGTIHRPGSGVDDQVPIRHGDKFATVPVSNLNAAQSAGWVVATDDDLAAREEIEAAKYPLGKSLPGRAGAKLITGVESFLASGMGLGAALAGGTGRQALAGYYGLVGGTPEENARGIRIRAGEYDIMNFVGEASGFVFGGGAVRGALQKTAPKLMASAGQRAAGRAVGFAAEGAVIGGLAANEQAWINDQRLTAEDLVWSAGVGAMLGASMPIGGAAYRATQEKMKKVFGAAKAKGEAALGGELGSAVANKIRDAITGGKERGVRSVLRSAGFDPERYLETRGGRIPDVVSDVLEAESRALFDMRMRDGTPLIDLRPGNKVANAQRVAARQKEILDQIPETLGDGTIGFKSIDTMLKDLSDSEVMFGLRTAFPALAARVRKSAREMLNPKQRQALAQQGKSVGEAVEDKFGSQMAQGVRPARAARPVTVDTDAWAIPAMRVWAEHQQLRKVAAYSGSNASRMMADILDNYENLLIQGAKNGPEFGALMAQRKTLRRFETAAAEMRLAGPQADPSWFGAALKGLHSIAIRSTGLHNLAAGSRAMAAGGDVADIIRSVVVQSQVAKRYFKGTAAIETLSEGAVKNLFSNAGPWAARSFNMAKATSGAISNEFQRGFVPTAAAAFARAGQTPGEAYQEKQQMLSEVSQNSEAMVSALQGRIGDVASDHPATTVMATQRMMGAVGFLLNEMPTMRNQGVSHLTPKVKTRPPSPGEVASFARKWETVMNPFTALDAFANGKLRTEHVQALRQVYPAFYEKLVNAAVGQLGEREEPLGAHQARQVETLLGVPGMVTQANSPAFLQTYGQATAVAQAQAPGGTGGPPLQSRGDGKPGRRVPTLAQQHRSGVDRAVENIHN